VDRGFCSANIELADRVQWINLKAAQLPAGGGAAVFDEGAAGFGRDHGADDETAVAGAHWI